MRIQIVAAETRIPHPHWATGVVALWATLIVVVLAVSIVTGHGMTLCWFRNVFGIPCITCGGTRCTLDLLQGRWMAAWTHNPLVAVGDGLFAVWIVARVGWRRSLRFEWTRRQRQFAALSVGLAMIANWAYVIWSHTGD